MGDIIDMNKRMKQAVEQSEANIQKANDILSMIRSRQAVPHQPKTYVQTQIEHIQGELVSIWMSIPDEGMNPDAPKQKWEPWMLKSIVNTLEHLDAFLQGWHDEQRNKQ